MPKTPATENVYRKYVLLDKPIFPKEKEGPKLLFKRNENQSYAFAIKKFLLKPLMRAEAKKEIANILNSEIFKDSKDAAKLLDKINSIPFWKGVKTAEFLPVLKILERAALEKNDVFCVPDKATPGAKQQNPLRDLLGSEFPELLHDFDTFQKEYKNNISSDENEKYDSSDECDEDFSSFESEEYTSSDESQEYDSPNLFENKNSIIENNNFKIANTPETYEMVIENKIFEKPSSGKTFQKESKEKQLIKQTEQENLKKEKEQIKIMQDMEMNEFSEILKQDSVSTMNELNNLRENIEPNHLKKLIQTKLESKFSSSEETNNKIYEGLDELISHVNDANKECSIDGDKKIRYFMEKIKKIEIEKNGIADLKLYEQITDIFTFYAEKYETARSRGQLAEITKVMRPELEGREVEEKQQKLAEEIRVNLKEFPVFQRRPLELEAFIDYFKNPDTEFDEDKTVYYAAFLEILYDNIRLLDRNTQTHCLNVADQLEGELQYDAQVDFGFFDTEDMDTKRPEVFNLVSSLQNYDGPSSSLLSFFDYLKGGQSTINKHSYWKLLQFSVNRSSAMHALLKYDDLDFFKATLQKLNADLRQYAAIKNINKPG